MYNSGSITLFGQVADLGEQEDYCAVIYDLWMRRSRDGGKTWEAYENPAGMGRIDSLAVDPDNMKTAYAGSANGRVFVSYDGAENWAPLGDQLDCGRVNDILVRPRGEMAIYVATDNGVYRWRLTPHGESPR